MALVTLISIQQAVHNTYRPETGLYFNDLFSLFTIETEDKVRYMSRIKGAVCIGKVGDVFKVNLDSGNWTQI